MRKPARARPLLAYVGSYTTPGRHGEGDGINVYRVDRRTGAFSHLQRLGGLENPSFLAINTEGTRLYSVHGDRSEINSFTIDPGTGRIAPLNRQPTGGYNPVHLAFDATGRFLAVCNYGTDSLAVFPLAADGSLLPYRTLTTVTGTLGPHRIQQRTMCVHHIPLDRQGRFFYVPCKGSDAVVAYRLDAKRKILGLNSAKLYGVNPQQQFKPVPRDYESRMTADLKRVMEIPVPRADNLSKIREQYLTMGTEPSTMRYGWMHR